MSNSTEYNRGRAEERAAIVEWMRSRTIALRIEAMEHLREREFSALGLFSGKE